MAIDYSIDSNYDICVVGGGPVGAYLAARLARAGIKVIVFEALLKPNDEPRAMTHIPILFKEFERAGIMGRMRQESAVYDGDISFRSAKDQRVVDKIQPKPGMPMPLVLAQHRFTELLIEEARKFSNAKIVFGHKVVNIEEHDGSVEVEVQDTVTNLTHRYSTKYLVGADGSKSTVRAALKTRYEGETLPFKLVAADVVFPFEDHRLDIANFLLGPEDFGLIAKIAHTKEDETVWRVSTGFPITMSDEDIINEIPNKYQRLCSEMKPGTFRTSKVRPYKAHQFTTTTMKKGKLLLIGDAAHLTNPYSGQSLASGIFDASSLAQCLVSIINQGAPEKLLDDWNEDRLFKFRTVLDPLSRGCFAAVRDPDVDTIGQRHPFLKAMKAGPTQAGPGKAGTGPSLHTDVTKLESWHSGPNEESTDGDASDFLWSKP